MSGPRVHDGDKWIDVVPPAGHTGSNVPVPQKLDGDGKIFVTFPSFRDGKRCAATIKSIFENAKDPDNVVIGLVEQNGTEDEFCLEAYCKQAGGFKMLRRQPIRKDMTKIFVEDGTNKCPRFDQIRLVAEHNIAAKGPADARALSRKILGNEEFCMQTDAHMVFAKDWDEAVKEEWKKTGNEFAIISTVPASKDDQSQYESWTGAKKGQVPRQCFAHFTGNGVPEYSSPADGKAMNLETPLLSHGWSAAFSFAKCHLEETAPYDPFTPYTMGIEQFGRYARFWTRGYDVYTPTRNIVFHDYNPNSDGHDSNEWMKRRRERLRKESIARVRFYLVGTRTDDVSETDLANLGIYGLGKRRTVEQLEAFVGVDLLKNTVNHHDKICANQQWVPYDSSISPLANMYSKANDLDPQPEFPLRTETTFYEQIVEPPEQPGMAVQHDPGVDVPTPVQNIGAGQSDAPMLTLFSLWLFGLVVWCVVFVNQGGGAFKPSSGTGRRKRSKKGGYKNT